MLRLPRFRYLEAHSVAEATRLWADAAPNAAYVAGGTDLYPNMKRRHQTPATVISLHRIPELRAITGTPETGMTVGACVTLTELAAHPVVRARYPAVAHAAEVVSTPILRNMGTIGGNLLLDTRCNYYNQTYEWRKAIDFCMKRDGEICWVAPSSPRCWAVQSSDGVPDRGGVRRGGDAGIGARHAPDRRRRTCTGTMGSSISRRRRTSCSSRITCRPPPTGSGARATASFAGATRSISPCSASPPAWTSRETGA